MRPLRSCILLTACASLLTLQLSGVHMHINEHGFSGVPVGTHVHRTAASTDHAASHHEHAGVFEHHHDSKHDGDHDVSVATFGLALSKIMLFLGPAVLALVLLSRVSTGTPLAAAAVRPMGRRDRWRPPSRAPPILSSI